MLSRFIRHGTFSAWLVLMCGSGIAADPKPATPKLNSSNISEWREHILPGKSDLGWQAIPWLTTLEEGILDADQRKLPLLFWTMNGHPLGCT